jgi:hypothetical protein
MSEIPTPPPAPNFAPNNNQPNNSAMPIAAMVCGILGLIGVLPVIGSILAVVFAGMAKKQPLNPNETTFVKIGVITGWIGIGISIAVFLIFVIFGFALLTLPMN